MTRGIYFACALALGAGCAQSLGEESPTKLEPAAGDLREAAHIYYNLGTGERVITLPGEVQTSGADAGSGSVSIWASLESDPCASAGFTTQHFYPLDQASGTTSLATAVELVEAGDIAVDTVVDCVHVNWVSTHVDTDLDGDGVGDGVAGLAGRWTMWDADNGRAIDSCLRLPLISFVLTDLPGNIAGPDSASRYSADIDLVDSFTGYDLSFEIGDSDGDCQTAAYCNNDVDTDGDGTGDGVSVAAIDRNFDGLPDSDLDGDGLFDWSWSVRFIQPGTADLDGDGVIDGVPPAAGADVIGVSVGVPEGEAVDNGDGEWTWQIDTSVPDAGTGQEDGFGLYSGPYLAGMYVGYFWLGGFSCEGVPIDQGGAGYTPPAMFEFQLFGPPGQICCCADINMDGALNYFDLSAFIQQHNAGGDYNGDGASDFFDIAQYIQDFQAGCP